MKRSLAVLTVLFLLLRPLCDVQAAGHDWRSGEPHNEVPCCADLKDGPVANSGEAAAVRVVGESEPAFAAPAWAAARQAPDQYADARHRAGVPFTRTSYYARSARIQR